MDGKNLIKLKNNNMSQNYIKNQNLENHPSGQNSKSLPPKSANSRKSNWGDYDSKQKFIGALNNYKTNSKTIN